MEKKVNHLEIEKKNLPEFSLPLTKEQKKVENAFNNDLASMLSLMQGKAFKPAGKIPVNEIPGLMEEFFAEEFEAKKEEAKKELKEVLNAKVQFDKTIAEEVRKFQAIIIQKKKEMSTEMRRVINLVGGVEQLKLEYLKALSIAEDSQPETEEEDESADH